MFTNTVFSLNVKQVGFGMNSITDLNTKFDNCKISSRRFNINIFKSKKSSLNKKTLCYNGSWTYIY